MFKTIRSKLLVILLTFILTTMLVSVIVFNYYENNKHSLSSITQSTEQIHILLLKDIKVTHEFFENETINPRFFETGKSLLITEHMRICETISNELNDLNIAQENANFKLNDSIENLKTNLDNYKIITSKMFKQILIRGYKNYGIEGQMRKYAHELENYKTEIGLVNILQLRRHEKDFIIRQEDTYIKKHNDLIAYAKDELSIDNSINPGKKKEIINALNDYSNQFTNLVNYEKKLGLKNGNGLKKQIDTVSNKIESSLAAMVSYSAQKEKASLTIIRLVYLIIAIVFLLIGIGIALAISKRVSRSITSLKDKIDEFVKSDFTKRTILPINNSLDEIDVLTTNFSIMEQHIVDQMTSLKLSNNDLEMLFYAASHNIKHPLLRVKSLTNNALTKTTDPLVQEYLNLINQSWEKLIAITDELGIITDVRNEVIQPEDINLEKLVRTVYTEFKTLEKYNDIIFSLDVNIPRITQSSPRLMKAIFRNLIENSIKYSTKRTGLSFLKISISNQNEEILKIEVSDNGIGIKKEYHDKIFDMFFRVTSQLAGEGLGLYIVKRAIEKLKGKITIESEENVGTTFTLLIPRNYENKNIKENIIHNREISELAQIALN